MKIFFLFIFVLLSFIPYETIAQSVETPQERLYKIVQEEGTILDDSARQKVVDGCGGAQTLLKSHTTAFDVSLSKRIKTYDLIQREFKGIELRMTKQGADASELDLLIGALQQKIDSYVQTGNIQKNLISDLTSIQCQDFPAEFKSGMDRLRYNNAELINNSADLRSLVTESKSSVFVPLEKRLTLQ